MNTNNNKWYVGTEPTKEEFERHFEEGTGIPVSFHWAKNARGENYKGVFTPKKSRNDRINLGEIFNGLAKTFFNDQSVNSRIKNSDGKEKGTQELIFANEYREIYDYEKAEDNKKLIEQGKKKEEKIEATNRNCEQLKKKLVLIEQQRTEAETARTENLLSTEEEKPQKETSKSQDNQNLNKPSQETKNISGEKEKAELVKKELEEKEKRNKAQGVNQTQQNNNDNKSKYIVGGGLIVLLVSLGIVSVIKKKR